MPASSKEGRSTGSQLAEVNSLSRVSRNAISPAGYQLLSWLALLHTEWQEQQFFLQWIVQLQGPGGSTLGAADTDVTLSGTAQSDIGARCSSLP